MEMDVQVDVREMEALIKQINALPGFMAERIYGDGLIAAARVVRDAARQTAAFADKTGRLRASIRATARAQRVETVAGVKHVPGGAAQVRAGGSGARQAMLVEYGHGGPYPAPPHPYLEPAIVSTTARQFQAAVAALRRSFTQLGRDLAAGTPSARTRRLIAVDR